MAGIDAKSVPQLYAYHKLFVDEFVSKMKRKLKKIFEERKMKEKKEQMYKDKEKKIDKYWKRYAQIMMEES